MLLRQERLEEEIKEWAREAQRLREKVQELEEELQATKESEMRVEDYRDYLKEEVKRLTRLVVYEDSRAKESYVRAEKYLARIRDCKCYKQ